MTDKLTARTASMAAFVLALANLLAAWGVILPVWATTTVIALANTAALSVAAVIAAVKHQMEKSSASA